jgi:hypothetical protein
MSACVTGRKEALVYVTSQTGIIPLPRTGGALQRSEAILAKGKCDVKGERQNHLHEYAKTRRESTRGIGEE